MPTKIATVKYAPCNATEIPSWARFDVPGPNQRVTDRSDGSVRWYRLEELEASDRSDR
jgi:hypothetical protein